MCQFFTIPSFVTKMADIVIFTDYPLSELAQIQRQKEEDHLLTGSAQAGNSLLSLLYVKRKLSASAAASAAVDSFYSLRYIASLSGTDF